MDGYIAELAIYDRVLAAGEVAAFDAGFSPLCNPNGLVDYVPLIGASLLLSAAFNCGRSRCGKSCITAMAVFS